MKIENRIVLSNVFNVALIILIGIFAFQSLNLVLAKLRFAEIADDLNASFLEMRLSEKNYFLYKDERALLDIQEKIEKTLSSIKLAEKDIIRAIGERDFRELESDLKDYSAAVLEVKANKANENNFRLELNVRARGKRLKEFSEAVTRVERTRINEIISNSKKVLFFSFWAIFVSAIVVSHFISQKILRSLREIEKLAKSISEGNFHRIGGKEPRDELGSVIKAINSMSEELRNREDELIQSKKLASLGVLTAGVAHELTNPLNNISMIAQTYAEVYDKLGRDDRIGFMNKVEEETDRIKEIVKNLLDFSKPKEANLKEADIGMVMRKTFTIVKNMLDVSNIDARLSIEGGLPPVVIDEHQIQQVLVNLVTNAVQAMSGGGKLFLSARRSSGRDSIEITVMDSGKGIAPEFLPHIFDPFFSTKGEGGTGLGLSVSYGIIKNHKGDIRVESKVGVGTTFTIELQASKKLINSDQAKSGGRPAQL